MPVMFQTFRSSGFGPSQKGISLSRIVIQRHIETTGSLNQIDRQKNDLPGARCLVSFEVRIQQRSIFQLPPSHYASLAIKPENHWWPLERTEHKREATIGAHMSGSLVTASCQVEIKGRIGIKNAQGLRISGRDVDASNGSGRCIKKNPLTLNECDM